MAPQLVRTRPRRHASDRTARRALMALRTRPAERMVVKSFELPADAVIYDLEDAVPIAEKQAARDLLTRVLGGRDTANAPRRYVRVNHPSRASVFAADLACAVELSVEGIGVPKVETPDEVRHVDETLAGLERERGLAEGSTRTMLLIESPLGLLNAYVIAASSPRTIAVSFGGEDFSRELGLPLVRTGEAKELIVARSNLAIAAAAAGVQSIDVIWTALDDLEGLEAEAGQARRLGFTGKAAIHPDQRLRSTRRSVQRPTKWPTPSGSSRPTRQRSPTARARSTTRAHSWKSRSSRGRGGFSIWRRSTTRPRRGRGVAVPAH